MAIGCTSYPSFRNRRSTACAPESSSRPSSSNRPTTLARSRRDFSVAPLYTAGVRPRFTHVALRVKDLDRSVEFYGKYPGLVVCHERIDEGTRVVWLAERAEDPEFVFVLIPMAHAQVAR